MAYKMGLKSVSEVINMDISQLKTLFRQHVLEHGETIFMVDDDMEIPEANLFSHAMLVNQSDDAYNVSCGLNYGRGTQYYVRVLQLKDVLEDPENAFRYSQWLNKLTDAWMREYICKPKICLNLPFGAEETHLKTRHVTNYLLQPSYHLGGARYPAKKLPIHPVIPLEEHLKKYLPYAFQIALVAYFVDPTNLIGRCVLPWNDKGAALDFKGLGDVFKYIADKSVRDEICRRFWKNVEDFFRDDVEEINLRTNVLTLIATDVDAVIREYAQHHRQRRAFKKLGDIYKLTKKDAEMFWEFGTRIVHEKPLDLSALDRIKDSLEEHSKLNFKELPLTEGFYLIIRSLGLGEFSKFILD
jgi:hypothetical protein